MNVRAEHLTCQCRCDDRSQDAGCALRHPGRSWTSTRPAPPRPWLPGSDHVQWCPFRCVWRQTHAPVTIPRVSPSLVGAALAALSRCACARVRALATAGVGVTVGSKRGRRAETWTPRESDSPCPPQRCNPPSWRARGEQPSRLAVGAGNRGLGSCSLAAPSRPRPCLPPPGQVPTAPLDGVVSTLPLRPTRPTTFSQGALCECGARVSKV